MINHRIILGVVFLVSVVFSGNILASQNSSTSATDNMMDQIGQVKDLLDSYYGSKGVLVEAKEKLDKILTVDPKNYRALRELSRYYIMDGYINSVVRNNGRNTYYVGKFEPGTLERAEKTLKTALQINPDYAEGYVLLGHIYTQQSRMKEAKDALTRAENMGTNDPWLHLNWATWLLAAGQPERAARRSENVLNSGTKQKNALVAAYSNLIEYHKDCQEYKQVDDLYKKICELDPTNAWARGNYADFLRKKLGRFDEAITYAREALSIMNYGIGRRILALCLYAKWADLIINQKKPESQAQKYYEEAFQLFPDLDYVMAYEGSSMTGKALAKLLVSKGTSVDARAEDGSTALIIACNTGRLDIVKHLLSLGANPNAKANNGWTPLHGAADDGYREIVEVLLQSGADPSQRYRNMDTATWAEMHGKPDIANLIRQHAKTSNNTGPKN